MTERISNQLDTLDAEIRELSSLLLNAKQSLLVSEAALAGIRESLAGPQAKESTIEADLEKETDAVSEGDPTTTAQA